MNDNGLILLVLAAIAGFLLFRLRNVLGDRSGFENTEKYARPSPDRDDAGPEARESNVVPLPSAGDGQDDADIFTYTEIDTELGQALKEIKNAEPGFDVREFMDGARGAYEMLLMAFETGDKDTLRQFLSKDVYALFSEVIDDRRARDLSVDVRFVGIKSAEPIVATFNPADQRAEVTVRYSAEIIMSARNQQGEVVEGDPSAVRRINDVWTFSRILDRGDPNWTLVATGE